MAKWGCACHPARALAGLRSRPDAAVLAARNVGRVKGAEQPYVCMCLRVAARVWAGVRVYGARRTTAGQRRSGACACACVSNAIRWLLLARAPLTHAWQRA
jgi:hypothetical protein